MLLTLSNTLADCRESALAAQDKQSAIAPVAQKSQNLGLVTLNNFEYHSDGHSIVTSSNEGVVAAFAAAVPSIPALSAANSMARRASLGLALQIAVEEIYGAQFNPETHFVVRLCHNVFDCQLADLTFKLFFVAVFKFGAVKNDLFVLVSRGRHKLQVFLTASFHFKPGGNFIGIRIAPKQAELRRAGETRVVDCRAPGFRPQ